MTFDLEYNSERPLMIIPEYGRHIQKLVDHCLALETKEERDKMAKAIIGVMGNLNPHLRDVPDFQHKLMGSAVHYVRFQFGCRLSLRKATSRASRRTSTTLTYPQTSLNIVLWQQHQDI